MNDCQLSVTCQGIASRFPFKVESAQCAAHSKLSVWKGIALSLVFHTVLEL
jgi:hypothetical protein